MTPARPLAVVLPAFLVIRAAIFLAATSATDSIVYHQYGVAARVASVAELFRKHDAEYPQLAVAFSAGVGWLADQLPPGAERMIASRPSKPPDIGTARFQVALGIVLFAIDLAALLLIARLTIADPPRVRTWRLGLYVVLTSLLGPILYDRLDLVVGFTALLALAVLARGWPAISFVLLAAGAAFKIVPALVMPVLVLAAAARADRFWPAVVRQSLVAGVILAAWPVLAYLAGGGDRAFIFLRYHSARGLELGSVYAAPVLLMAGGEIRYEFGGYAVRGELADRVAKASPFLAAPLLVVAVLLAARALRRAGEAEWLSVAAAGCALVWLVFILTAKVGSPQYLLWLSPLAPLVPLRTREEHRAAVGLGVACLVTTLTYPYLWPAVHGAPLSDRPGNWAGPNVLGYALLFARWGLLAGYTAWLAVRLARFAPGADRA